LLILTLARRVFQPRRLVPSSGPFGQILSVPRHLLKEIFREYFNEKEGGEITIGSRWGGDRICPNDPDEG